MSTSQDQAEVRRLPTREPQGAPVDPQAASDHGPMAKSDDVDGCQEQLTGTPPADLYAALTRGSDGERALAAQVVLTSREYSHAVIQRAIYAVTLHPSCPHLRPLTDTLRDKRLDDATRSAAALALGTIARDFPCMFPGKPCPAPHDPIPQWSQHALVQCSREKPTMVARACVEALGFVSTTDRTFLRALRDDPKNDSMLRIFAGRALTRLTRTRQVSDASLNKLVEDAWKVSRQQ